MADGLGLTLIRAHAMDDTSDHAMVSELLGVYVLNAVDAREASAVERHLPTCTACQAELADYRTIVADFRRPGRL